MSAVKKSRKAKKDLVVGLGATGLSIARYLNRSGLDAKFVDSRDEPPGIDELSEVWPDADVSLGDMQLPKNTSGCNDFSATHTKLRLRGVRRVVDNGP